MTDDLDSLEKLRALASPGPWSTADGATSDDKYEAALLNAASFLIEAARERDELRNDLDQTDGVLLRAQLAEAELAALRAHLRQAVEALEPFDHMAKMTENFGLKDDDVRPNLVCSSKGVLAQVTVGDFRRARDCLASLTAALGDQRPAPASTEEGK